MAQQVNLCILARMIAMLCFSRNISEVKVVLICNLRGAWHTNSVIKINRNSFNRNFSARLIKTNDTVS